MDAPLVKVLRIKDANGEERLLSFPAKLDLDRPKRPRTQFNPSQLGMLEDAYRSRGYVSGVERARLADNLGLTDTQVKVWFQNRRTKDKKRQERREEEKTAPAKQSPPSVESPTPFPNHTTPPYSSPLLFPPLYPLNPLFPMPYNMTA